MLPPNKNNGNKQLSGGGDEGEHHNNGKITCIPEKFASIMEEPSNGSKPTEYIGSSSFSAVGLTSVSSGVSSEAATANTKASRMERNTASSQAMSRCS